MPWDTLITVTSDVLEGRWRHNIGVDSVCSRVDIDAVEAVYAVEVRGGSTAPADGVIEYVHREYMIYAPRVKMNAPTRVPKTMAVAIPRRAVASRAECRMCMWTRLMGRTIMYRY